MTLGVHRHVARYEPRAIALRPNDGESASVGQLGAQVVAVQGLVADQRVEGEAGDQRFGADAVVALTRQESGIEGRPPPE
jgi:hypothetical protein